MKKKELLRNYKTTLAVYIEALDEAIFYLNPDADEKFFKEARETLITLAIRNLYE